MLVLVNKKYVDKNGNEKITSFLAYEIDGKYVRITPTYANDYILLIQFAKIVNI